MYINSRRRLIILICALVLILIPFLISLFYGNIPLYKNANTYNNVQSGTMYGDQNYSVPQGSKPSGLTNNASPHYSSLEAKYYASKEMTFSHVFRDMIILLIISILSMILERKFRILDSIFRR